MGPAGQAAAAPAGRSRRGLLRHVRAHFRAVYADVVAGAPSSRPGYPTFADGHDEMLVGDAIARSAREGRWVDVDRSASPPPRPSPRRRPMRLGLLTAPFPETPLIEVVDWTAANGFESIEIACWPRRPGPTRRYAGTSHIDVADLSAGQARDLRARDRGQGPVHLRAGLLPEPAPSRTRPTGRRSSATSSTSSRPPRRWTCPLVNTFMGGDGGKQPGRQLGGGAAGLAGHRRVRPGPRPQAHHRELPDAVQPRRVAGRPQPGDEPAHLAAHPRAVGRHDRAQLRPVAPGPPDDRHPALHPRVRAAHPATSRPRT